MVKVENRLKKCDNKLDIRKRCAIFALVIREGCKVFLVVKLWKVIY